MCPKVGIRCFVVIMMRVEIRIGKGWMDGRRRMLGGSVESRRGEVGTRMDLRGGKEEDRCEEEEGQELIYLPLQRTKPSEDSQSET